jgi:hypothetical protein
MASAAARGDYLGGIAIGENYLRDHPDDTNVLQQTAILTLTQAKQEQNDRDALVAHAVALIERSLKGSHPQSDAYRFTDGFIAARAFESAGDLSSNKCPYYRRGLFLNNEALKGLTEEFVKLPDGKELPTKPLREQGRRLQSDLEKRVSKSRCGPD